MDAKGSAKACCTPSRAPHAEEPRAHLAARATDAAKERMVELPGGAFLMGTDDAQGFPQDGEGPVREVRVKPFWIDRCPVTNALFAQFVRETSYRTEAERFGSSFVFW